MGDLMHLSIKLINTRSELDPHLVREIMGIPEVNQLDFDFLKNSLLLLVENYTAAHSRLLVGGDVVRILLGFIDDDHVHAPLSYLVCVLRNIWILHHLLIAIRVEAHVGSVAGNSIRPLFIELIPTVLV